VRIPRLEVLLGCQLGELTWAKLCRLIEEGLSEEQTLDFKAELYSGNDKGKHSLASDMTAFANASGGMVILGVGDSDGRATDMRGVDVTDGERVRMVKILLDNVAPILPDLIIGSLAHLEDPTRGVYLLVVPPSDAAPHALRRGDWYMWPVREDRTTRQMLESELASRYRTRFAAGHSQLDRLRQAESDGLLRLSGDYTWLTISVAASKPGHLPADREGYRSWLREYFTTTPWGLSVDAGALLGRRRVIFTDRFPFTGVSTDHHVELHTDGAGFAAIALSNPLPSGYVVQADQPDEAHVDVTLIAGWTVALLDVLARHATRTGASGDLSVRARIVNGSKILHAVESWASGSSNFGGYRPVPGSRPLSEVEPFETGAPLSITTSPRELVATSADIAHELIVEFGAPPTQPLLRLDGSVDATTGPAGATFRSWADRNNLLND
jgi:hypothetical protein